MEKKVFKVFEFFSGIGGLRIALNEAIAALESRDSGGERKSSESDSDTKKEAIIDGRIKILGAYDINANANLTYELNFKDAPKTINVQNLKVGDLDGKATCWLLSPPCQPYTRGGLSAQVGCLLDWQALSECKSSGIGYSVFRDCKSPPTYFFVENVIGFNESDSHSEMLEILKSKKYSIQQFHLSPTQFGIPNTRVRYYCCAVLSTIDQSDSIHSEEDVIHSTVCDEASRLFFGVKPTKMTPMSQYLEAINIDDEINRDLIIPTETLQKHSTFRFDVVDGHCTASTTVTKGYGRLIGKSGPIVVCEERSEGRQKRPRESNETEDIDPKRAKTSVDGNRSSSHESQELNEISVDGSEIVEDYKIHLSETNRLCPRSLHGYSKGFTFPKRLKRLQRYALIGNSIKWVSKCSDE
ncbi:DNA (cytosine-5)-methyltransferase-like [Condylostylus longicornis]|uniref:DNA (cytosine-5)-methyltransferase-like n=1 Tax=Condylostylus longicornis TaxID=2530218 RepID=UPI00244DF3CC|nr:DNA (cytosine-5)-methyltransferase-like [Condylostylus longicornis]